jgi:hypothetical protein
MEENMLDEAKATIQTAVRRNVLDRLLEGKQPIHVFNCAVAGDISAEAGAAAVCVSAAQEVARRGWDGDAPPSPHDVVRRVADHVMREKLRGADGVLLATAVKVAVDAAEAAMFADATAAIDVASVAVSAAAWAAAALVEASMEGDLHQKTMEFVLEAALVAADGVEDDTTRDRRAIAGAVVLAAASALRAYRNAALRAASA